MSLIVAKKFNERVFVISDTKLTYNEEEKNIITSGTIKTIIIGKEVNLSFAGYICYAEDLLKWIEINKNKINLHDLISALKIVNVKSCYQTEFILCIGGIEIKHTEIIQIKDGKISDVESAWIGSYEAFRKFQEVYVSYNKFDIKELFGGSSIAINIIQLPSNNKVLNEFYLKNFYAMNSVIQDSKIKEVDGFIVASIYISGSFRYLSYAYCFPLGFNKQYVINNCTSTSHTLSLGSSEEGSYAISLCGSSKISIPIYIPHGKIGILYSRKEGGLMKPTTYSDITQDDFSKKLKLININAHFINIFLDNNTIRIGTEFDEV